MSVSTYNNHTYAEALWKGISPFRCPVSYEASLKCFNMPVPSGLNRDVLVDMRPEGGIYRMVHFVDSCEKVEECTRTDIWVLCVHSEGRYTMTSVSPANLSAVHSALLQVKSENS